MKSRSSEVTKESEGNDDECVIQYWKIRSQ